jgi:solute carrier family 35 protein F5
VSDKDASSSSSSSPAGDTSIWGDLLCLVSALFYASYVVVMRRALPDEEEANVALFFGYVGLFSTLALGPVVGVAVWSGAWNLAAMPKETYGIIAVEGEFFDF